MSKPEVNVVTGAFSYTGKYITRRLLGLKKDVRNLTGHPGRPDPFGGMVLSYQYNFSQPQKMGEVFRGATTLYNTYWIRFARGDVTFDVAVENSKRLIQAARDAGVRRIVHVSITHPDPDSPLPYFRGKARVEEFIRECGISHAILRPAVIYGDEDILINNIAWFVRRFPIFGVFGSGDYGIQPIHVEDMADLAVQAGQEEESQTLDAVGPDIFTYRELVKLVAEKLHRKVWILRVNPRLAFFFSRIVGWLNQDVVITRDEIEGLMAGLLVSGEAPRGKVKLGEWLEEHANHVGMKYASELGRHFR
jgi:NADH dehydrogenase